MYGMFEDEDDIFMGSPESKLMDVIFNANNDVVRFDLANFIKRRALMELFINEHFGDDFDKTIDIFRAQNSELVENKTKSLYIELMGEILSKSE